MSLLDIKPPKHTDGQAFAGRYKKESRDYIFGSADRFDESTRYATFSFRWTICLY